MLRKMLIVIIAVIVSVLPMGYAFAQDGAETEGPQKAVTGGIYSDDDLVFDYTTGVEHITGYDYIYSNPPSSNKVNVTLQNTSDFQLRHFYYFRQLNPLRFV